MTAGRPGFGKSFTVARKRWQLASGVALPPTRGLVRPGGGGETYITPPPMFRGTTMQTCGFWPWVVGSPAPLNAVPLGADTRTGKAVRPRDATGS